MNKQKVFAIALVVLLGTLAIGGTSAYFTYSDTARNVITSSGVKIELIEDTEEVGVDGRPIPFTNVDNAMPGDRISKIPKIKNVDEGEVFVRMRLFASVEYADGREEKISPTLFNLDFSRSWSSKDGYYYYMYPLGKGETTQALFTTVVIPKTLADKYQNAKFALTLKGEAVQTANNGATALEAQGWPGE